MSDPVPPVGDTDHIGDGDEIPPGLGEVDQDPAVLPDGTVTGKDTP